MVETRPDPIINAVLIFRVNMSQDDKEPRRFTIEEEQTRQYRRFNARGNQLTVRLLPPPEGEDPNPMSHFLDSVTELFQHALRDLEDTIWWELLSVMKLR